MVFAEKKRPNCGDETSNATEQRKVRFGLRSKMILFILCPLVVVLSIVGSVIIAQTANTVGALKRSEIDSQTQNVASVIDDYFHPFLMSTELAVNLDCIQEIFAEIQRSSPNFDIRNAKNYQEVLNEMKDIADKQNEGMITLWIVADRNNQLLHSNGNTTGEDFVLATRPWFKQLVANSGEMIVTSAYEDVVSGEMVVSCAVAVYEKGTDNIIGAVGMDISLESLIQQIGNMVIGEEGYITAYDCDDVVLYHPDSQLLLKHLDEINYSQNMKDLLNARQSSNAVEYTRDGKAYCGSVVAISDIGWNIVGTVTENEYRSEVVTTSAIIIAGFILCAILLSAVIVFVAAMIVRPLRKLNEAANQLANGDLDVVVDVKSGDEVGQMSVSITQLVARLKTYILYINEVSAVIEEIGRGNLIFELKQDYVGEFNRIKVALSEIKSSLSRTMLQITDSVALVDTNTTHIASASQGLAQGSVEQASTIQELFATVQDLAAQSVADAQRSRDLSLDVQNIGNEITEGNHQMQQMVAAMENITTQSAEIASIIKTIEDIAFQTNILALNAAVEAARAGAAGKGFAVVADEVRSLATKSSEAAKSITTLIQSSVQAVSEGSQIANDTASSLGSVAQNVGNVMTEMEQFAARYQRQASELEDITTGIDQISAVVQNNSATAEQNAATSEELSTQVHLIRTLTERFKVDESFRT